MSMYEALNREKETWTLFHCLYKDRLEMEEKENDFMEDDGQEEENKTVVSPFKLIDRLFFAGTS